MWFLPSSRPRRCRRARHLDVHDHEVGTELGRKLHGGLAVARLSDDLEAVVTEDLDDVHPDQRLIFGDDDASGCATASSVTDRAYGIVCGASCAPDWRNGSRNTNPDPGRVRNRGPPGRERPAPAQHLSRLQRRSGRLLRRDRGRREPGQPGRRGPAGGQAARGRRERVLRGHRRGQRGHRRENPRRAQAPGRRGDGRGLPAHLAGRRQRRAGLRGPGPPGARPRPQRPRRGLRRGREHRPHRRAGRPVPPRGPGGASTCPRTRCCS